MTNPTMSAPAMERIELPGGFYFIKSTECKNAYNLKGDGKNWLNNVAAPKAVEFAVAMNTPHPTDRAMEGESNVQKSYAISLKAKVAEQAELITEFTNACQWIYDRMENGGATKQILADVLALASARQFTGKK